MKIGDEVYIHGYIDEIRKDTVIVKNKGGYFGTCFDEVHPVVEFKKLIDADELERGGWSLCRTFQKDKNTMVHEVKKPSNFPTIEPKKGKWIRNDNGTYSCSVCQSWIPEEQYYYARYCLYCGTGMRGKKNV